MSARSVWMTIAVVGGVAGASLLLAGPAEAVVTCGGERATIVGTNRSDTLRGTPGHDVIVGRAGSDFIRGFGGRDVICGQLGSDRLQGGPGADRIFGGLDELRSVTGTGTVLVGDVLSGTGGDDQLVPGFDTRRANKRLRDTLSWETSGDRMRIDLARGVASGEGRDTFTRTPVRVVASDSTDTIDGTRGDDVIVAGPGSDKIHARAGDDRINTDRLLHGPASANPDDLVYAGPGQDLISSGLGEDRLYGGDGSDRITSLGPNLIMAGSGNDTLVYQFRFLVPRPITTSGGPGRDSVTVLDEVANRQQHSGTGSFDMQTGQMTYQVGDQHVEIAAPGIETIHLGGTQSTWQVQGTNGNDRVQAHDTNGTTFEALSGNDIMWGSRGHDVFNGGPGDDTAHNMNVGNDACSNVETFPDGSCAGAPSSP